MTTETDNSELEQDSRAKTGETAGNLLKVARERRGLTEKQVADRLHITMHYVRAIETDRYEKLPGIVFARGYIKSYALLLGLDKDQLVTLFDDSVSEQHRGQRELQADASRNLHRIKVYVWLLVAVLAILSGYLIFRVYTAYFSPDGRELTGSQPYISPGNGNFEVLGAAAGLFTTSFNGKDVPVNENNRFDNTTRLRVGL